MENISLERYAELAELARSVRDDIRKAHTVVSKALGKRAEASRALQTAWEELCTACDLLESPNQ